jgi:membrane protease YdiL (CAAX protease family)
MTLFWSCIAAFGAIIPAIWLQEQMPELPNFVEQQFDMILGTRWGYLTVGLLAPLAEEIVFRGAILRALLTHQSAAGNKLSPSTAIVASAVIFAVIHFNPAQLPHAFLVGLLLGWMYYRTNSILPGVAFHWVNNSVAYVLYNIFPDPDLKLADLFPGSPFYPLMAVGFSLIILLPALFQLHVWMKKE